MKLTFCGGARTVTGSSFLLEAAGKKILLDCGMFQGGKRLRSRNYGQYPYNPAEIDYVIVSHAHIDHSGLLPRLVRDGFRGKVLATPATIDLAGVMLPDSGYIQMMETEWINRKNRRSGRPLEEPLYTVEDAEAALQFFHPVDYYTPYALSPQISLTFFDAGHILGSAITELTIADGTRTEKIVYTGDLGKSGRPIIRDPDILEEADYLLLEGTYGSRKHEQDEQKVELLKQVILDTVKRQGNIVVPSFAVGRTQELLYYLSRLMKNSEIPNLPIYVDSPLAISATEIFARHPECYDVQMRWLLQSGQDPFNFPETIFTRTVEESKSINELPGGAMIISASGMAEAGRIKHHLKHNLWRPESTVLFVGYQAVGTLGRRILDGVPRVRIFGEEIKVNARVVAIDGFSAHADRSELLRWLGKFRKKPKQVMLVHGEEEALMHFSALVEQELQLPVYIPQQLETMELLPGRLPAAHVSDAWPKKAHELRQKWQSFQEEYTRRLEWALHTPDAEERLAELEKELAAMRKCINA
ncbi:MAG TPA: MBL fold metallo-hydrolase [Firmicutes bacterium]|nr:MBL fold metallo-hydrolase [Bacillota bacterium]